MIIFGPKGISNYVEIGRSIATMMIDEVCKSVKMVYFLSPTDRFGGYSGQHGVRP